MRAPALVVVSVTVALGGLAGCSRDSPRPAESRPPSAASPAKDAAVSLVDDVLLGSAESRFLAQLDRAEAVFIGTLLEVGPPPTAYSGYQVASQALTYRVVRVLRGDVPGPTIVVHQLIVARSPSLVADRPALAPAHTEIGADYLVALGGTMEGKRVTANENAAPIKATAAVVARAEQAPRP